jgi:hypothetical protein
MAQKKQKKRIMPSPEILSIAAIFLLFIGYLFGKISPSSPHVQMTTNNTNTHVVSITQVPTHDMSDPNAQLDAAIQRSESLGFKILSPKDGEILCRGKYYPIKWKAPANVKTIDLYIRQAGAPPSGTYDLGTFPANYAGGVFSWRVGFNEGNLWTKGNKELLSRPGYQIQISTPAKDLIDFSGQFTITDCTN